MEVLIIDCNDFFQKNNGNIYDCHDDDDDHHDHDDDDIDKIREYTGGWGGWPAVGCGRPHVNTPGLQTR